MNKIVTYVFIPFLNVHYFNDIDKRLLREESNDNSITPRYESVESNNREIHCIGEIHDVTLSAIETPEQFSATSSRTSPTAVQITSAPIESTNYTAQIPLHKKSTTLTTEIIDDIPSEYTAAQISTTDNSNMTSHADNRSASHDAAHNRTNSNTTTYDDPASRKGDDINEHLYIKMSSWNVCGCRDKTKRYEIDSTLHDRGVAIALLQEANIDASKFCTTNYTWYTGSVRSNRKRNLAILISKWYAIKLHCVRSEGPYVLRAEITYTTELTNYHMIIINVHAPNKTSASYLGRIGTILGRYQKEKILLVGDFNSHLAYEDSSQNEKHLLGKISCHEKTNGNGEQLKFFLTRHELCVRTMQSNNSLNWTWTNGTKCSQLDHVITPATSNYYVKALKGRMELSVNTDHKLITWSIGPNRHVRRQACKRSNFMRRSRIPARLTKEETSRLQEPQTQKVYQDILNKNNRTTDPETTVNDQWKGIVCRTKNAAQETFRRKGRLPNHKECRKMLALMCKYRFWMSWKPSEKTAKKLSDIERVYARTLKNLEEEECVNFFKN